MLSNAIREQPSKIGQSRMFFVRSPKNTCTDIEFPGKFNILQFLFKKPVHSAVTNFFRTLDLVIAAFPVYMYSRLKIFPSASAT